MTRLSESSPARGSEGMAPWLGWHLGNVLGWLRHAASQPWRVARVGWVRRRQAPEPGRTVVSASHAATPGVPGSRGWRRGRAPSAASSPDPSRLTAEHGVAALSIALSHPDPVRRARALDALCEFSRERATSTVAALLHDPAPVVRLSAIEAATRLGATEVVFSLIASLEDPDQAVRDEAARAIAVLTQHPVEVDESGDDQLRAEQIEALRHWWKERRFHELAGSLDGQRRRTS